jgi:hypothetical protein
MTLGLRFFFKTAATQQQQPPPHARGSPTVTKAWAEQPLASHACTDTAPTPLAHSETLHMPTLLLHRSIFVTLPTLMACTGKIEHFHASW